MIWRWPGHSELSLDNVRVVLNGGAYSAIPRHDGSFKLHGVSIFGVGTRDYQHPSATHSISCLRTSCVQQVAPGAYLLEVLDAQSVWPTVRLEVTATVPAKARALLTHSRQPLPFPLPLEPLVAKPSFFEKREGFQWSSLLMNPMVMMMGVTLFIMVVIPGMMKNMDPEALKEMQQMQSGGLAASTRPPRPYHALSLCRVPQ